MTTARGDSEIANSNKASYLGGMSREMTDMMRNDPQQMTLWTDFHTGRLTDKKDALNSARNEFQIAVQKQAVSKLNTIIRDLVEFKAEENMDDEVFAEILCLFIEKYIEAEVNIKINKLVNEKIFNSILLR